MEEELRQHLHLQPQDHPQKNEGPGSPLLPEQTSFFYRKIAVVVLLLLLISLVAAVVANLFEYLGFVEKRDKKLAHVV